MNLTPDYNSHTQPLTTGSLNCENHAVITVQCFEEIVLGNGHTYLEAYGHSIFIIFFICDIFRVCPWDIA